MLKQFITNSSRNLTSAKWTVSSNLILPDHIRYLSSLLQQQWSSPYSTSEPLRKIPEIPSPINPTGRNPPLPPTSSSKPLTISESAKELLPLLVVQPFHYIVTHIHGKPYLVTKGDIVRLPFKMPGVVPGDVLRLNRATCIGSRDYTLKGTPYLDERMYECRATVIGTESEPMRFKEKTKRRCRKVKTVKSKHRFTILRIAGLELKGLADMEL